MISHLQVRPQASGLIQQELAHDSLHHPNLGGVTQGGMANHYPMTLLALRGLGATDAEILNFKQHGGRSRTLIEAELGLKDTQTVQAANWQHYLGQSRYLREFRRVFGEALTHQSSRHVVHQALAVMQDGLPMGLFHPLIRLSFAYSYQDLGQIADALAYMAIRYQDLFGGLPTPATQPQPSAQNGPAENLSAQAAWQKISRSLSAADFSLPVHGGSLQICEAFCGQAAIQAWALDSGFAFTQADLDQQIQAVCLLALRLYLHQPALTTLHAVTAAQALAELRQSLGDSLGPAEQEIHRQCWQRYWVWLTGLFIEKGHPLHLPQPDPAYLPELQNTDWDTFSRQARCIPEAHLIKMTYSCRWLALQPGLAPEAELYYKLAVLKMLREHRAHPRLREGLAAPVNQKESGFVV